MKWLLPDARGGRPAGTVSFTEFSAHTRVLPEQRRPGVTPALHLDDHDVANVLTYVPVG